MLEEWVLGYWNVGLMENFVLAKNNYETAPFKKPTIPSLLYSMIAAKDSNLKKYPIFPLNCINSET